MYHVFSAPNLQPDIINPNRPPLILRSVITHRNNHKRMTITSHHHPPPTLVHPFMPCISAVLPHCASSTYTDTRVVPVPAALDAVTHAQQSILVQSGMKT
jgi:hypothetical protein